MCAAAQTHLRAQADVVYLASLVPQRWATYIRTGPSDDIRPLGTRRLPQQQSAWGPSGRGAPTA